MKLSNNSKTLFRVYLVWFFVKSESYHDKKEIENVVTKIDIKFINKKIKRRI